MGYETKLLRTFSHVEPQKLSFGLLVLCFFMVSMVYISITKPDGFPLSTIRFRLSAIARIGPTIGVSVSSRELGADERHEKMTVENKSREQNDAEKIPKLHENNHVIMLHANSSEFKAHLTSQDFGSKNGTAEVRHMPNLPKSSGVDMNNDTRRLKDYSTTSSPAIQEVTINSRGFEKKPLCDVSDPRVDLCEMYGDIRLLGNSSSVLVFENSPRKESWRIRPYARKQDREAMSNVREVSIRTSEAAPRCSVNHSVPAIVFSIGGYTGNFFHDFTDVFVPLFLTSYQFNGQVQFLITNTRSWWIQKYLPIFKSLSNYEVIDFDNDDQIRCFPRVIIGLVCHKELSIDPWRSPNNYSMVEFTKFMRSTYSLDRNKPLRISKQLKKKPRLLIISRSRTRRFTNLDKIIEMAERLGYEVVAMEAGSHVAEFARIVNSCDVMMGVHGAGLTNLVFLPTNAVLIQIVPWGNLDWISRTYFKEPSMGMKLRYLEYRISEEESTLIKQYPREHPVFRDPYSIHKQGWGAISEMFLVKQSVKLNVRRFRPVLVKAIKLLHQS